MKCVLDKMKWGVYNVTLVFQMLMNVAPFLACAMEETVPTLLAATSASVHEATSPAQMGPDVLVSHIHT